MMLQGLAERSKGIKAWLFPTCGRNSVLNFVYILYMCMHVHILFSEVYYTGSPRVNRGFWACSVWCGSIHSEPDIPAVQLIRS